MKFFFKFFFRFSIFSSLTNRRILEFRIFLFSNLLNNAMSVVTRPRLVGSCTVAELGVGDWNVEQLGGGGIN